MAGNGQLEITDEGVKEFSRRGRWLVNDLVVPFGGEGGDAVVCHVI